MGEKGKMLRLLLTSACHESWSGNGHPNPRHYPLNLVKTNRLSELTKKENYNELIIYTLKGFLGDNFHSVGTIFIYI